MQPQQRSAPIFPTGRGRGRTGLGVVYNLVTAGMHGTLDIDSEVGVSTLVCSTCRGGLLGD